MNMNKGSPIRSGDSVRSSPVILSMVIGCAQTLSSFAHCHPERSEGSVSRHRHGDFDAGGSVLSSFASLRISRP